MDESERDHYLFLHAAFAKCETCLAFWLHHGADLSRRAASHPDWIALEWARASNASPEILGLLIQYALPSCRVPSARGWSWICTCTCPVGLTGDVSASWPRGREIINSCMKSLQSLRASFAGSRSDTCRGTPCEPLKSAFRWAEEASLARRSHAMPDGAACCGSGGFLYCCERQC